MVPTTFTPFSDLRFSDNEEETIAPYNKIYKKNVKGKTCEAKQKEYSPTQRQESELPRSGNFRQGSVLWKAHWEPEDDQRET